MKKAVVKKVAAKKVAKKVAVKKAAAGTSNKAVAMAALRKAGKKGLAVTDLIATIYGKGSYSDYTNHIAGVLKGLAMAGTLVKKGKGAEATYSWSA